MNRQLEDLRALAAYLADIRSALDSFRAGCAEEQARAHALGEPLAEIERFVVGAVVRLERYIDAQSTALRSSRVRYQNLVDHLPVAIYVNRGDRIVLANAACAALFGATSPEELLDRSPFDFYDPADHETIRGRIVELRARNVALPPVLHHVIRLDGQRIDVEVAASSFDDDGRRATHVVLRDVTDQHVAERAVRESEERFRTEFEHATAGRCLSAPDGRIIRVNRSLAAMLGLLPDAMKGRAVEEFIHPEDRDWSRASGLRLLAGEAPSFRCEIRFLRGDGSVLWADLGTALYRDSSGTPVHFIADIHDITSRKRAEAESVRSWARLETLAQVVSSLSTSRTVEAVAAVVVSAARTLVDADGATLALREGEECRYVDADANGPRWKGMRFPIAASVSGWAMLHGDQVAMEDVFADPRAPQESFRTTFVKSLVMTPAGREDPAAAVGVYWGARHVATPEELGILRALSDSASVALENVAAYDSLRRSEERYRNLIESLDDLVYAVDAEGRLTYVSGAVARFGYKPAEVVGRRFQEFAHPDDREGLDHAFRKRLEEDVGPYEFRVFDGAGKVRIVRSSGRRVFEDGRLVGLGGVLIDLTAQRSTEEQLRAVQKMEAVGRLAGGVAHDFNNLLTVINSYAKLAARGLEPTDRRREELAEIQKAGDRAASLTRQLLAFGRRQLLQADVIDVNALVAGTERMLARLIGEDVRLRVIPAPDAGRIRADAGQVEQVLMNLAVNARDAMPQGGELTIETGNASLDEEFLRAHLGARTGPFVRFRIRDTGCGMDEATRVRVFEPFFTTKPAGKGTGLGLATVYGIVKQSGGSIWVESEPGRGATFDVYFPRVEEPAMERPIDAPTPHSDRGAGTILFVEDDEAIRALADHVLSEEGYRVLLAANGGEALVLAERHGRRIHLVVSDVVMPGMSGKDLAARLQPLLHETPVLFMSGYGHDAISQHGILQPGTLFLPKPFTPEALAAKVRDVMRSIR